MFILKAALMWTISDLPGYSILSGWGSFDGTIEWGVAPKGLSGVEVLQQLDSNGKTKDNLNARHELAKLGVRKPFHAFKRPNGRWCLPPGPCNMALTEKDIFCNVLKSIRASDGYASNILKALPKHVVDVLIELSTFFRKLCSKVNDKFELEKIQDRIALTLCHLERIFPPSFFDIIEHLPIYLAEEALIAGAVQYRWMYPIERFLMTLKKYMRNKAHPEGSIAKGYVLEGCMTFCSRCLSDVESNVYKLPQNNDGIHNNGRLMAYTCLNFGVTFLILREKKLNSFIMKDLMSGSRNMFLMASKRKQNGKTMMDVIRETVDFSAVHDPSLRNRRNRIQSQSRFGSISSPTFHATRSDSSVNSSIHLKKGRGCNKPIVRWNSGVKLQLELTPDKKIDGPDRIVFKTQIGVLARNSYRFSLIYTSFREIAQHLLDDLWYEIKENTTLPDEAKNVVLEDFCAKWRQEKYEVKRKYFRPYEDGEERLDVLSVDRIPPEQLKTLVGYWKLDKTKVI
ncbi:UNVERIFIED_CONTAM: hypothetical protein Sradi_2069700 [Sesamum radiatum]|uniref:DUF4218 domain-containing protein n=1 Tax=Sesamum radiatum TaxID=300843 RepID=A0AAW2TI24_SESRA